MHLLFQQTKTCIKNVLGLAILSASTVGCSKTHILENPANTESLIVLESLVANGQTRMQNTQFDSGEALSFFVTKSPGIDNIEYNNVKITANGSGGFSYTTPMYYPLDNSNVNFYAIHPYSASASLTENNGSVAFSTAANQTTLSNYVASDLLYASKSNVSRTKNKVALTFTHQLSKISFTIKAGSGMDLADLSAVSILGIKPSTGITIATGQIEAANGSAGEVRACGVRGTVDTETQVTGIQAIIVPQTIASDSQLFKITIGAIHYYYKAPAELTFASGNNYRYELTINQTGIDVSSSITPWTDNEIVTGEGEAE